MKSQPILIACLGLVAAPAVFVRAQTDIPVQYALRESVWTITAGIRARTSGVDVNFSQLGSIDPIRTVTALGESNESGRIYDNGYVAQDLPRAIERDADGNVISTPGQRYQLFATDEDGNNILVGDYISHSPGFSRSWGYAEATQLTGDGRLGMNIFSTTSDGASATGSTAGTGGVELGISRRLGRIANRAEWGLSLTMGLTDINSSQRSRINATLNTLTDFYSLNGQTAPGAPFNGPTFVDLLDNDGNVVTTSGFETTVPIAQEPSSRTETSTPGGAEIDGYWQIKGAYYMMRFGPHFRGRLNDRLAINVSAGVAAAHVGTQFRVEEFLVTSIENAQIGGRGSVDESDFILGFYAEAALEYWITPRTGLYASATYEGLGEYSQAFQDRTAKIDLGKGPVFRFGMVTRF